MQSLNIRFSALDLANPSQSGDLADPDNDEQPNLLDYAFNRNPQNSDTSSAVTATFPSISGTFNHGTRLLRRLSVRR